ncbi:FecR family protein [Chitinophaga sp. NPDC101104]|uniref:FecR family protein n=1 Tax=Chitinophaga sp. NPDC101104 TaxID=3390561 RepID=UPI003D01D335
MSQSPDHTGMDWNKILESLEEAKITHDMTKEEFSALAAAREARALLAAQEFDEDGGWREFTALREKRRTFRLRIVRLAVAAGLALAIGAGLWIFAPAGNTLQTADAAGPGKVRLRTADGRILELDRGAGTIQDNDIARIQAGGDSLVYTAGTASTGGAKMDTLEIPVGMPFQLLLADGTKVWLNATSKLIYPAAFHGAAREVYLEGEGYFEVAQNASQPFLVHSGKTVTTVLGTAFNIRAYDASVITTLSSGKVKVTAGAASVTLQPDEQSTFDPESGQLEKAPVVAADMTAWVQGNLYFDGVPLADITESLGRYYGFDFTFDDAATGQLRFTLDMPRPATIGEALAQLKASRTELHFQINGKVVTVSRRLQP